LTVLASAPPSQQQAVELEQLLQSARAQLIADPREALQLANKVVIQADAAGDDAARAAARQVRGDALRFLGRHEPALLDYGLAGDLFRRLHRTSDAARTDASAVDSLRCLGRAGEALRRAARARRAFRRTGEELRSAVLDEIVGLVYLQQNEYTRALRLFDRARPVIAAAGRPIDLATLNNNAATTLTNLDRLREAQTLYAAARAVYAEHGTDAALARVDVNLGYLAFRQGRYGEAVDLLRQAVDVFESLHNVPMAIGTRLDLADTYLALNLLDEAGALSQQQLDLAAQFGLLNEHARALFYVSTQRARLGRLDDALGRLIEAESEFAAQGNALWQARCAVARAALLLARGRASAVKEAIGLCRRASRAFGRLGLPSRQALASAMLARALLRAGRARPAEDEARSALWLAQGVGVPWLLFECHYTLGRVLRVTGQRERAYVAYREAADALERVRAELQPEELRISLVSDKTDLYQELVLLCLERSATVEALRHAERAKSRAFAERLETAIDPTRQGIDARLLGPRDAGVLERMRELRNDLIWLYSRLSEGVSPATLQRFRQQVASREAELLRLQRRLQPASRSHVVALGIGDATADAAATLERLRRRLPPGTVVLEYFQAGDELVLFVFNHRRLSAHRLGPVAGVLDRVERFRFQITKFALGDDYVGAHATTLLTNANALLRQLYDQLIGPCADNLVDARQLVIVPHGGLHYLPFHALIDPTGTPLVERVELTFAPSSTVLASRFDRPAQPETTGARVLVGVSDAALPHIDGEIEALRDLFEAPIVLAGEAATEEAFRRYAPDAEVIHLASHAVFRQDNPLFSAIRLADGWLSLNDLYSLRLRASLVTLSACETGVSDVLAGDELVGLARGFFQAGAGSVVVSLWAVNDASTARLMQRFYRHLEAGQAPAAAMRLSQIELRREYPHPYFWAPFLVIGRP
jgi:tetratricopeptide (TPR) repeat protein